MKVLLINPNRYKSPPVPPIGLEYIRANLNKEGQSVKIAGSKVLKKGLITAGLRIYRILKLINELIF